MGRKTIAVLGGGDFKPGHMVYDQARCLGKLLAEAGYNVINGGYGGVMEASARGVRESGNIKAKAIGIVMARKPEGNEFLTETGVVDDFFDRLRELMSANAFIIFPGGAGTVLEIMATIVMTQKIWTKPKPIIIDSSYFLEISGMDSFLGDALYNSLIEVDSGAPGMVAQLNSYF